MSSLEVQAREFISKYELAERKDQLVALNLLPADLRLVVNRLYHLLYRVSVVEYCSLQNVKSKKSYFSPSSKYRLDVFSHSTKPGSWNYTSGHLFILTNGNYVPMNIEIYRNYSAFPFTFIEDHSNGHDYLVCGEDYQCQTVIELDTGKRKDTLPDETFSGFGFCWAGSEYSKQSNVLIVEGCHWACPYEIRFYDFSSPMDGWPYLECVDGLGELINIDSHDSGVKVMEDDTIQCTYTRELDDESEIEAVTEITSIITLARDNDKFKIIREYISDAEIERRQKQKEGNERHRKWLEEFQKSDPLFLLMNKLSSNMEGKDTHFSTGIIHDRWCPDYNAGEKRMCKRVVCTKTLTVDVEWGVDVGPIKVISYSGLSKSVLTNKFFMEHSINSMEQAFEYVNSLINQVSP